jgi:hypothetical protein
VERSEPSGEAEAREGSRSGSGHFWSARSCGGSWRQELGSTIFLIKIKSKFLVRFFRAPFSMMELQYVVFSKFSKRIIRKLLSYYMQSVKVRSPVISTLAGELRFR